MKEGLSGFLKKPYHRKELSEALHNILHAGTREKGRERSAEG
jgi:hypothetical protein